MMNETTYTGKRVQVRLVGEDGNAFVIMGRVTLAMRRAGLPQSTIDEYRRRCQSGNYDHLLQVTMEYVTEEDEDEPEDTCSECGAGFGTFTGRDDICISCAD